jgi:hypothetical protein
MNCARCNYLLWDLSENRCPECGHDFEVTDYAFKPRAVHFLCRACGQSYLGTDLDGLPYPRRFECLGCGAAIDAASLMVHPLSPDAIGEPTRMGTPWEQRHRVGTARAFVDGLARLATQPGEYFRLAAAGATHEATLFSIVCAYLALLTVAAALAVFRQFGGASWLPDLGALFKLPQALVLLAAVPLLQIAWNYLFGTLIQAVLWGLGQSGSALDQSVRAVAFGSAVLPAVLLLPPIGLLWYVIIVSSGIEHFQATTRSRAVVATLIPMLLAANVALGVTYAVFY